MQIHNAQQCKCIIHNNANTQYTTMQMHNTQQCKCTIHNNANTQYTTMQMHNTQQCKYIIHNNANTQYTTMQMHHCWCLINTEVNLSGMEHFREKHTRPLFLVVSDDMPWCRFSHLKLCVNFYKTCGLWAFGKIVSSFEWVAGFVLQIVANQARQAVMSVNLT